MQLFFNDKTIQSASYCFYNTYQHCHTSEKQQTPALHSAQSKTDCAFLCKEDNTIRYGFMVSGDNGDKRRFYCRRVRAGSYINFMFGHYKRSCKDLMLYFNGKSLHFWVQRENYFPKNCIVKRHKL